MSVKYKLIERVNPRNEEAADMLYAYPIVTGTKTLKDIGKDIADISSLSYGDITSVLNNLILQVPKYLKDGYSIRLEGLGTFQLQFTSEGVRAEQDFNFNLIEKRRVVFRTGSDLRSALSDLKFERI